MIYSAVKSDVTQLWMPFKELVNIAFVVAKATFSVTKEAGPN